MTTTDPFDALMASGAPAAKFPTVGTTVRGEVLDYDHVQQTDYQSGAKLTWDNGDPKMQFIFTLQTDERDPDLPNDDGVRRLYAKSNLEKAVVGAIKRSGATRDQIVGGTLAVQYTGDGEPSKPGFTPPKLYNAEFRPAAPKAAGALLGDQAPATAQPAPAPAAGAAPAQPTTASASEPLI